ncbi:MAG: pyridoxal-phosphate dependent enzyme [Owenweeksia sp.]|nr:pyridoxal-phosphate dependent enzyme [Owenweeksia sp.]
MVNAKSIAQAAARIAPHLHDTPVFTSQYYNKKYRAQFYFKAENLQKTGSFKPRGAINAVWQLDPAKAAKGVATHSSGNHGQALAWAARQRGLPAYVVMPENAPQVKVRAIKSYAAEVIFCKANLAAREETLSQVIKASGATFIPPYNYEATVAGQATVARELLEVQPQLDMLLAPVGGGGLLAGTALSAFFHDGQPAVYGCEPAAADDARQSLEAGKLIPVQHPITKADGLRTSLGPIPFAYIERHVPRIFTCSEEGIGQAMRSIWERMKLVIEPSAAVPLACVAEAPHSLKINR